MKNFIYDLMKAELPLHYYYHSFEHTNYVMTKVAEIGKAEKCTKNELRLLNAAALWHDIGFINTYSQHEEKSCMLAREYLPSYGFNEAEINAICGMIMATKLPQNPQNKLEEIIADADLEYLGTDNAYNFANDLYSELKHLKPSLTKKSWNKKQIEFLQSHHYFTNYCKNNREAAKNKYLAELIAEASKK
jgi:uncharacterized protein